MINDSKPLSVTIRLRLMPDESHAQRKAGLMQIQDGALQVWRLYGVDSGYNMYR